MCPKQNLLPRDKWNIIWDLIYLPENERNKKKSRRIRRKTLTTTPWVLNFANFCRAMLLHKLFVLTKTNDFCICPQLSITVLGFLFRWKLAKPGFKNGITSTHPLTIRPLTIGPLDNLSPLVSPHRGVRGACPLGSGIENIAPDNVVRSARNPGDELSRGPVVADE